MQDTGMDGDLTSVDTLASYFESRQSGISLAGLVEFRGLVATKKNYYCVVDNNNKYELFGDREKAHDRADSSRRLQNMPIDFMAPDTNVSQHGVPMKNVRYDRLLLISNSVLAYTDSAIGRKHMLTRIACWLMDEFTDCFSQVPGTRSFTDYELSMAPFVEKFSTMIQGIEYDSLTAELQIHLWHSVIQLLEQKNLVRQLL